jgi:hypothetical protein
VFTARCGLIPYIKHIKFRIYEYKANDVSDKPDNWRHRCVASYYLIRMVYSFLLSEVSCKGCFCFVVTNLMKFSVMIINERALSFLFLSVKDNCTQYNSHVRSKATKIFYNTTFIM